jgi:hypothetical protein
MSYKGKYQPSFPKKYKGNPTNIVYRSLWERTFMKYCDTNENILEWFSEEICVAYFDPTTSKIRFIDTSQTFISKLKRVMDQIKKYIIEIKPKKQTVEPIPQKRKTKGYIYEVYEYAKNQAKWKAAEEWCADRGYEFKVLTEDDLRLGVQNNAKKDSQTKKRTKSNN